MVGKEACELGNLNIDETEDVEEGKVEDSRPVAVDFRHNDQRAGSRRIR